MLDNFPFMALGMETPLGLLLMISRVLMFQQKLTYPVPILSIGHILGYSRHEGVGAIGGGCHRDQGLCLHLVILIRNNAINKQCFYKKLQP